MGFFFNQNNWLMEHDLKDAEKYVKYLMGIFAVLVAVILVCVFKIFNQMLDQFETVYYSNNKSEWNYLPTYHKSWNELLTVWKKVWSEIGLWMNLHKIAQYGKLWAEKSDEIKSAIVLVDITVAHTKISDIIFWYNKNKEA